MNNKGGLFLSLVIVGIVLVIGIVIGVVYFSGEDNSRDEPNTSTRNPQIEQEFTEIMDNVVQEQAQKGVTISYENIEVNTIAETLQGSIDLLCDDLDFETDEAIIKSIAEELFTKYPEHFSENSVKQSEVMISSCSQTGSSPDGINTYYSQTRWSIFQGHYDFAI
jgi:hypothetical protein